MNQKVRKTAMSIDDAIQEVVMQRTMEHEALELISSCANTIQTSIQGLSELDLNYEKSINDSMDSVATLMVHTLLMRRYLGEDAIDKRVSKKFETLVHTVHNISDEEDS